MHRNPILRSIIKPLNCAGLNSELRVSRIAHPSHICRMSYLKVCRDPLSCAKDATGDLAHNRHSNFSEFLIYAKGMGNFAQFDLSNGLWIVPSHEAGYRVVVYSDITSWS